VGVLNVKKKLIITNNHVFIINKNEMKKSQFKQLVRRELIKEAKGTSYESKLAEIEKQGQITTLEAKIDALAEMIETKNNRLSLVSEDENLSELIDKKKIREMQKEIKLLEKTKLKLEKLYEKKSGGKKKDVVIDEDDEPEIAIDAADAAESEVDENFDMRKPGDRGVEGGTEEERTLDMEPGNDPEELDEEFNLRKYIGENRLLK